MPEQNKKRIYVVEDDSFLGDLLSTQFVSEGFDTTIITSGSDAFDKIVDNPPDILLLDIFLPGLDGITILEKLRENESTKDLKVIMVSNTDQVENRERSKELNAKFITKAMTTPDEIVKVVRKELE